MTVILEALTPATAAKMVSAVRRTFAVDSGHGNVVGLDDASADHGRGFFSDQGRPRTLGIATILSGG